MLVTQQGLTDEFPFDFISLTPNASFQTAPEFLINCNRSDGDSSRCVTGGSVAAYTESTPFLQEVVFIDNLRYYHLIVGDPATGFAQEVYIDAQNCCFQQTYGDWRKSASGVSSGSGNPTAVVMQMFLSDAEMTQTMVKDSLATKPLIIQTTEGDNIVSTVELDMSAIDYDTQDTPGVMNNTLVINDSGIPSTMNFNSATMVVDSIISAGMYTYTPGTGIGGSEGTYNYTDGGFFQHLADENLFKDPLQNP